MYGKRVISTPQRGWHPLKEAAHFPGVCLSYPLSSSRASREGSMTRKTKCRRTAAYRSYSAISVSPPSLLFFRVPKNRTPGRPLRFFLPKGGGFHSFFGGGCASSQKNDRLGLFTVICCHEGVFTLLRLFFVLLPSPRFGPSPKGGSRKYIYISAKYNISQKKS